MPSEPAPPPAEAPAPAPKLRSAARLQAPVADGGAPELLPHVKARKARARRPLPPLGPPLAGLALLLALAVLGLEGMESVYGVLLLPFAALALALSAAMPARLRAPRDPESAKLRLAALAFALLALLLVLALVEGLALFAATGLLFNFTDLAQLFVRAYPLLLGAFVLAGAGMRLAAWRWGGMAVLPATRRRTLGAFLGALGALLVGLVAGAAASPYGPEWLTLTVERAPFLAALGVMAGLGALWSGCLPSFVQLGDWLARVSLRRARLAQQLTLGLAASGMLLALAGAGLWVALDPGLAVLALGPGLLLAMAAGFPAGAARFRPALGMEDPDAAAARRRPVLLGLLAASIAGFALAGAGLLAGLAGLDETATVPAALVAVLAVLQAALALASVRAPIPGALVEVRRAASWDLSLAALLLTLFGVLLGSGVAQGPGVGPGLGSLLLLGAALASQGHGLLRVVLPPPRPRERKAKQGKTAGRDERDAKERITRSMHLAYAGGLGLTALMVALVGATSLGVVDVQESTGLTGPAVVVLGLLLGAPVAGYLAWRYLQVRRVEVELKQRAREVYKKRLTAEEVSRLTIIGASVSAAVLFVVLGLLTQFGALKALGPFELAPKFSTDFFVFAILVGLGPYGFMRAREQRRTAAIDQKLPELLRDLAESKRAGMTLTQAVITASKGSYGALTPDIRKMAAQIEWGISFGEALQRFARRVKTPLIERSVSLIVQASEAGGNVVDILHAAAEDAREIQLLLRERKTAMSIYVMIIYISFFVFLSVIAILDAQFLPEVAKAVGGAQGVSVGPIKFGKIDVEAFEQVFFHAALVQAVGGGFVAGVMAEGRPMAGLRHVFVMVIVGYVAFRFVIGG